MEGERLEAAKERAWAQKDRLNEMVDELERQLDLSAGIPTAEDAAGWADAVRAIAGSRERTEDFVVHLRTLFAHIRRCYPPD